nr:MAG TPA: hypothetical protein [Caudoviricetes sp.]
MLIIGCSSTYRFVDFCISETYYLEESGFLYKQSLFSMSRTHPPNAKPHPLTGALGYIEKYRSR